MKKRFVVLSSLFLLTSYLFAQDTNDKKISKAEWEQYQQYKQEQADKVQLSDEEYEQYQQYLKEKNKQEESTTEKEEKIDQVSSTKENKEKINESEIVVMFGKILNNSAKVTAKNSYYGTSVSNTDSDSEGWRIKIDGIKYIAENTGIGVGLSCFSNFESNETRIFNIDILLKQRFPLKYREKTYLYLTGGLGYGYFAGITKVNYYDSGSYLYYIKLNNGFHWMLSFGIDFTPFIIDLSYSCNYSKISTDLAYTSGDMSFCSVAISVGYKFNL